MRQALFVAAVLGIVWGGGGVASAGDPPRRVRQSVDLDVRKEPLRKVIDTLARTSGQTILLQPGIEETLTLTLRDVSWRIAVDVIAERTRCLVRERGGVVLLYRPQDAIDIELYDANVRTALVLLARYANKSIVIAPDVQGTITLRLSNVSATRALVAVAKTAGDFLVLGERAGSELKVGAGAKGKAAELAPEDQLFEGTFLDFEEGQLVISVKRARKVEEVRVHLSKKPALRALQERMLRRVRKGATVHVGARRAKPTDPLVLTHVLAPGTAPRAKQPKRASPSEKSHPKKPDPKKQPARR